MSLFRMWLAGQKKNYVIMVRKNVRERQEKEGKTIIVLK